jgi:hypothetical protein
MDYSFKPDASSSSLQEIKTPEFSFEEGLVQSVAIIQNLLKTLNRHIFVVINGSSRDVGKSTFLAALQIKLRESGVACDSALSANYEYKTQTVFFTIVQSLIWTASGNYANDFKTSNPNAPVGTYGDLYIGIYRPDKKFNLSMGANKKELKPVADIMICNTHAMDK